MNNASVVDGYAFQALRDEPHWYSGYWDTVVFCGGVQVNCANDGTDSLESTPFLTVKRADDQAFTLNSLDLDNTHDADGDNVAGAFKVTGMFTGGGSVSTSSRSTIWTYPPMPATPCWKLPRLPCSAWACWAWRGHHQKYRPHDSACMDKRPFIA